MILIVILNSECRSPSSTITFQGSMLRMNGSPLHNIISNTPHNMSGSAETNFTSSSVLTRLPDSGIIENISTDVHPSCCNLTFLEF